MFSTSVTNAMATATAASDNVAPEQREFARDHIYHLLLVHDAAAASRFSAGFPFNADESAADEIRRLNRYWRNQLCDLATDTMRERDYLVDKCDPFAWLRHFQHGVLNTVLSFGLPMV